MQDKTPAKEVGSYHGDVLLLHGCQGADQIPLEEVCSSLGSLSAIATLSSNRIKLIFKMCHRALNKKFASPRKVPLSPKKEKQMYRRKKILKEISNKQNTRIPPPPYATKTTSLQLSKPGLWCKTLSLKSSSYC